MGWWVRVSHSVLCVSMMAAAASVQQYDLVLSGLPDQATTVDLLGALASLFSAVACLVVALSPRSSMPRAARTSWVGLGAGLGLWTLGDLIWFGYELAGMEPSYPGPGDVLYLIGIPVLGMGLVGLARSADPVAGGDLRLRLDTVVLASALALITYLLVLRTAVAALGLTAGTGLLILYPVTEVVFAALAGVLVVRSHGTRERADLMLLTAAFVAYLVADGYYAVASVTGVDYTQSPLALGYVAGPLLIGLAATTAGTSSGRLRGMPSTITRSLSSVLPDLGVFVALLVCSASTLRNELDWMLVIMVLGLTVLRQASIATFNQRLHGELAGRVRERTASLQRLSDHHEGILDSVGEGVVSVDAAGAVTFANPAAAAMLGAGSDSLLGADSRTFLCPAPPEPGHRCVLDLARDTGTAVTLPNEEFRRTDGIGFPVEVTAAPQQSPGTSSGVVLVFRDTTERLAVSRMKSEFVSAVSHELRTPLTSIRGALELLHDGEAGELSPTGSKMVATALRGSERLTRLINDIIDIERLEAGSLPMHLADVEVDPVVQVAVSDLRVLASEKGVQLVVTRAAGRITCDADRLVQALVNLIGNAIKFSPRGGIVEICAEPAGTFVQFEVSDRGRGVPATHLVSIFERFHQVRASDGRDSAGTGLGLPITRAIVEQHGGQIWVESTLGQGSTFGFTMPLFESRHPQLVTAP